MPTHNSKQITLTEYQFLHAGGGAAPNGVCITQKQFDAIESFVLRNVDDEVGYLLRLGQRKGVGKILQAQQYVGVIQLTDGTTIEILPKITQSDDDQHQNESRQVLINMLRTLPDSHFRHVDFASLKVTKMPLFEVFIGMFLQALAKLVQRGIKNDYITREENTAFLKGKLLFSQHIKHNLVHKERFYVAYDNYLPDRIENQIIKTTLLKLYGLSRSGTNQQRIREFQFVFDDIASVQDIKVAFSKVKPSRQMKDYEQVLDWCKILLLGNSFAPSKGSDVALSLLFDMNKLFEAYVGHYLKKHGLEVSLQDKGHHLACQDNKGVFALRPDIVIGEGVTIADTKWKVLSEEKSYQGISQSDVYQMYAYATKYQHCQKIALIYPKIGESNNSQNYCFRSVHCKTTMADKNIPLNILFFDLSQPDNQSSVQRIDVAYFKTVILHEARIR